MLSESILLAFLFAIAAGLGWFFAKRFSGKSVSRSSITNEDYFRGVNYLLNEQPDKALEVFVRMVEVDQNTAETHFALGGLFRKRGEVDRAIRVHQNLMARPNLDRSLRNAAMFELAQDYLSAGLLDRAEGLLRQVSQVDAHRSGALEGLIRIYEAQKDWEKALLTHKNLLPGTARASTAAHYHCELALLALKDGELKKARDHLRSAKSKFRSHVRAAIIRSEVAVRQQDFKLARRLYRSVIEEQPEFSVLVLNPLQTCMETLDRPEAFDTLLSQIAKRSPAAQSAIANAAVLDPQFQHPLAEEWAAQQLQGNSMVQDLLEGLESDSESVDPKRALTVLRALMPDALQFRCQNCGLTGTTMFWLCPSCKDWDTTTPFTALSFEIPLETHP